MYVCKKRYAFGRGEIVEMKGIFLLEGKGRKSKKKIKK